ncbi:MAG: hypothetical protein KAH23_04395 [Kiritimatiellae bacterium]|nr:hypothetical protein [Kiritimatiellia bacterium]
MKKLYGIGWKIDLMLMLVFLPLVGLVVFGKSMGDYMEFPPLTRYVQYAEFSWPVFISFAIVILAVVTPFVIQVIRHQKQIPGSEFRVPCSDFPWWGWAGLAFMGVAWVMAWTRFPWFASMQSFTFTPVWLGYIIVVNGLSYKRTGHCILRDRTGYLIGLFIVSAVFWWYFEYLNRFVQNWYYEGIGNLSRTQYFVFATLPFSTVLPAVLSTNELLRSIPRISAGLDNFLKIRVPHTRILGCLSLAVFSVGLTVMGLWSDYLFPLLWVSPLFMITSLQAMRGEKTIFSGIATGNWRNIYLLALSALICGFFWELWNYGSLARWIYEVPFVNRFKIFEMPVLGYAGYLPFGLECAVIMEVVMKKRAESQNDYRQPSVGG